MKQKSLSQICIKDEHDHGVNLTFSNSHICYKELNPLVTEINTVDMPVLFSASYENNKSISYAL